MPGTSQRINQARSIKQLMNGKPGEGSFFWANDEKTKLRYQIVYVDKAFQKRHRLSVTGTSMKDCLRRMKEKTDELDHVNDKKWQREKRRKSMTLTEGMLDWVQRKKVNRRRQTTVERMQRTIINQIGVYPIGHMKIDDIDFKDIEAHLMFLQYDAPVCRSDHRGYCYKTVLKTYDLFNGFLREYYATNLNKNPMNLVDRPQRPEDISEITLSNGNDQLAMDDVDVELVLNDEEMDRFKEVCFREYRQGVKGVTYYGPGLYFILLTFIRVGEAIALTWSDVDLEKRTLIINKTASRVYEPDENGKTKTRVIITRPKTKAGIRTVGLTDEAVMTISEFKKRSKHTEDTDFIFATRTGERVTHAKITKSLKAVLNAANLNENDCRKKFGMHYLRHSGISYYLRHGVPVDVISKMAGHSSIAITQQVYYHVIHQQDVEAIDLMNRIDQQVRRGTE